MVGPRDSTLDDADNPGLRDVEFIRAWAAPTLELIARNYFRVEYRGLENAPRDGQFMAIGNHSGAPLLPDVFMIVTKWWELYGVERPAYAMVHDAAFRVPLARDLLIRMGALRASRDNANRVLDMGGTLLAYPGGEQEAQRSYRNRNKIDFRGRTGFIEVALERGLPILPVVSIGGHEVYMTLLSSEFLARVLRLESLIGVRTFTVNAGLPWGIWPTSLLPYWPLPTKIVFQIGKPLYLPKDSERARDRVYVGGIYAEIVRSMQTILDELAEERRFPVIG